ncbi:M15 family metallopeptidase [Shewanella gelidimarina]|uniref:M15 family metallopeptidase n=1 Tax=Shewanella gelidimarina TaxID=56813 RepID=UPI002010232A|nr:M15 family metallopeptidase [Shewanella gelidimarina]
MPIAAPHLYGLSSAHLIECYGYLLEQETANAFDRMRTAAEKEGLAIEICSAFRDFDRQQLIWNAKASGTRVLLNKDAQPVDIDGKTAEQIMALILLWSALPGTSRHHWGTDIDIFDSNKISKHDLQLIPQEYQLNGPCYNLSLWLMSNAQHFGFYLPFQQGLSGVSAEPWHLSYYPVSKHYVDAFNVETLADILQHSSVLYKEQVLDKLDALTREYVYRVAPVPL